MNVFRCVEKRYAWYKLQRYTKTDEETLQSAIKERTFIKPRSIYSKTAAVYETNKNTLKDSENILRK